MKKVAVGIISRQSDSGQTEYLLVSSAKDFGEYTGYYYPPGGHVEEELSLKATITKQIAITPGDVPDQETHWYECAVEGEMKIDPELSDARYFAQAEIETGKVWPATQKVFRDYIFQ